MRKGKGRGKEFADPHAARKKIGKESYCGPRRECAHWKEEEAAASLGNKGRGGILTRRGFR